MKKYLAAIGAVVAAAFLFTGCSFIMDVNTSIKNNGAGTVSFVYGMDQELYEAMKEYSDSGDISELNLIDLNGTQIYGEKQSLDFSSLEELNRLMTGSMDMSTGEGVTLFRSFEAQKGNITGTINNELLGDSQSELTEYGVIFDPTISFTFEGKVKETNGRLSGDGHTVTYNMLTDSDIRITYETPFASILLIAVIGVFLVIGIVAAVILLSKNSKKNNAASGQVYDGNNTGAGAAYPAPTTAETPVVSGTPSAVETPVAAGTTEAVETPVAAGTQAPENTVPESTGAAQTVEQPMMKYCTACGNRIPADAVFCPVCGKKIM